MMDGDAVDLGCNGPMVSVINTDEKLIELKFVCLARESVLGGGPLLPGILQKIDQHSIHCNSISGLYNTESESG